MLILCLIALTGSSRAETWLIGQWTNVSATDRPSDGGGAVIVRWSPPPALPMDSILGYEVLRSGNDAGPFEKISSVPPTDTQYVDGTASTGEFYYYRVAVVGSVHHAGATGLDDSLAVVPALSSVGTTVYSAVSGPVSSSAQWFNLGRLNQLIVAAILCTAIFYFIRQARSGKPLYVRKIAGLQAVEEAIGRATEMGRPILFIPGIHDMDDVQTIAGLTILARVARTVAEYETTLNVPVCRSLVMTTARESIKEAYQAAGRPDAYNDQMVHYVTDEQFGYVAAVDGIMMRQKPATCLYMGAFFAESLIVAETGAEIGAIQIAGTAQPAQLPFFVAACDYTLIGEELFAASAYLSGEPRQLGSLKGQDVGKVIAMGALALSAVFLTVSSLAPGWPIFSQLAGWVGRLFQVR